MTTTTAAPLFTELGLHADILRAINDHGYTTPTPIQVKAIPEVLAGGDLLAAAQTGTGKTAGFTLPILHRLMESRSGQTITGRPRCLIMTPTRELAAQVEESVKTYGKYLPLKSMVMFGGVGMSPQVKQLRNRVDILVATPGRLLDHHQQRTLDLSGIEILVLDEADRMLDMGFIRDIRKILALLPKKRQNLLFSATFSSEIKTLADGLLDNPAMVEVARRNMTTELVEQSVTMVDKNRKRELLRDLIVDKKWEQVLVFSRTKHGANRLAEQLEKDGISATAIHGNKSQTARTKALFDFKNKKVRVLVATDIAARGLDIEQLPQVVNYELPNVPEDYVHRIGRTGRAGSPGNAISLVDREEEKFLRAIERLTKQTLKRFSVPGYTLSPAGSYSEKPDDEQRSRSNPSRTPSRTHAKKFTDGTTSGNNNSRKPDAGAHAPRRKSSASQPAKPNTASGERSPSNGMPRTRSFGGNSR
jgi:ATP-dependent RNA helicase RhlE